jgi:hypothetical protein
MRMGSLVERFFFAPKVEVMWPYALLIPLSS